MSNAAVRAAGARPAGSPDPRNVSVDVAKGMGILLVVLGHNGAFRTSMHAGYEAVYLFHVPLFFFLSGVTFKPENLHTMVRRRIRSLLVPYFAMGVVSVAAALSAGGLESAVRVASGVLYGTGHTLRFTPLWFLPCLFLVTVTAASILQRGAGAGPAYPTDPRTKCVLILFAIAITVAGLAIITCGRFASPPFQDEHGRPLGLPWSLDLVPVALGVFIAGMLCARSRLVWQHRHPLVLVVVSVSILAVLVSSSVSLDLNYRRASDPLTVLVGIVSGIALVIGASELIVRSPWLARAFAHLGSTSLVVLIFHGPLQRRVLEWLTSSVALQPLVILLGTGLTIAIICAADLLILRRVPAISWIYYPQQRWQS